MGQQSGILKPVALHRWVLGVFHPLESDAILGELLSQAMLIGL